MEWLKTTQSVIALISALVVLLGTIAGLIPVFIKRGKEIAQMIKEKKCAELIESLKKTADATIRSVETSKASGADKKDTVLKAIQDACVSQGVEFTDDLRDQMSSFVDQSVTEYNEFKAATIKKSK